MRRTTAAKLAIAAAFAANAAGCVVAEYQDDTRRIFILRGLTDTGIGGFTATTPEGTTVTLEGYTSDQAKAIDLLRTIIEAAK